MPTVAILTTFFYRYGDPEKGIVHSGADRYLVELARLFRDQGWQVVVFQIGKDWWEAEYEGMAVRGIPGTAFDFETNPDLNRVFNEMALSADLRVYFAPHACFPQVVSPCIAVCHGIWWDYPGHPLANGPENIRKEYFRRVRYNLTAADAVVCVDTNVINFVRATWPGEERRMVYIPNFVDTEVFRPREEPKDWERPRVLYPRRLTTLRGSNEFLWAVREMPDVDFIMAGYGDEELDEEKLADICRKHNNLWWSKYSFEEMPEVYRQADVAVIPTRACEGTSLACLEAMASGLPVVATTVGGLPNLVIDGYNGLLVDFRRDKLHNVLRALLSRPDYMTEMGRRGREMARVAFDIRIWRAKWLQVVSEVLR